MAGVQVNIDMSGVPWFRRGVRLVVAKSLTAAAASHSEYVVRSFSRIGRFTASPPGSPPNVRTGALRRGARIIRAAANRLRASSGIARNINYAMIHERGGTITSKGKLMPVPLNDQARRISERASGSLRSVGDLRVIPVRGRRTVLLVGGLNRGVSKIERGRTIRSSAVPVWVLKQNIRIPPRPYLKPALTKNRAAIMANARKAGIAEFRRIMGGRR